LSRAYCLAALTSRAAIERNELDDEGAARAALSKLRAWMATSQIDAELELLA
jgi:hypothetical protein